MMTDIKKGGGEEYVEKGLQAGLSSKASCVYVALLKAGKPLSPKGIILSSGLHRQYVYDALEELSTRGLISKVGSGRASKYVSNSPDTLIQEVERKRADTLDGVQSLMKLYEQSPAGVVEVIRGERAVIESEFKVLEEAAQGDFLDIIGGAGMRWVELFEGRVEEWERLRKEKGVRLRYIGTDEDVRHNKEVSVIENESRSIPNIGDIVNVSIRPESVSFNIYDPEVMTVRVRSLPAVMSQRALFEVLWNIAT
jgi:predicted transcriptional regulator